MSEYSLSIATSDNEPFIPLQIAYNLPKAERLAVNESRMYPGCRVAINWLDASNRPRQKVYKYGRKLKK